WRPSRWRNGLASGAVARRVVRIFPREQFVARLPQRQEEHVAQRALEHLHWRAAGADRAQAQVTLRQLEVHRAEEVEDLVKVGERLGALVEGQMLLWALIDLEQCHARALERRAIGVPQARRRAQDRAESRRVRAAAVT